MNDLTDNIPPDKPEESRLDFDLSPDFPDEPENELEEGEVKAREDPLTQLRQNLLAEEQQPEPQSKPDLLQRMTGTLATKKVPTRPRSQSNTDQGGFGVLTPRSASSESASQPRSAAGGDEIHDDFLEKRLGGAQTGPQWARPVLEKTDKDPKVGGSEQNPPPPVPLPLNFEDSPEPGSKVRPQVVRRLDPLWDGADPEEDVPAAAQRSRPIELPSRPVEDRKMIGSGAERQYEVNRYLSYNPKQSLWGQFLNMSALEQWLLAILILAVIAVGSLIVYLYLDSRHPVAGQNPTGILPTTGDQNSLVMTPSSPGAVPVPVGLEFPGGWKFSLKASAPGGQWAPVTSEWLSGTEIRRVVGIPWNKQIEAVVQTFGTGDTINLRMNNGDTLTYKVSSISQVDVQDSSVLHDTRPSLAVILINSADNKRWVVIAFP